MKQEALQAGDAQGAGHFGAVDDSAQFLAVSERLASLPDCQAIEQELKTALGMSGVRGHRLWRRLRGVLLKRGCIEEFIGQHNSKPVKCIRLLKPWAPEDSGESGDDEDVRGGIQGRQLAEETIDRQILKAILDAGRCVGGEWGTIIENILKIAAIYIYKNNTSTNHSTSINRQAKRASRSRTRTRRWA